MQMNTKNGTLSMDGTTMDYIRFGSGPRTLVMLPGLGESLRSMKGTALPMAALYRFFARDFTVYSFSRKLQLPEHYTTRDMARDLNTALDLLGIGKIDLVGISMGGMISQHFAADYPERVNRLVLAVTCPRHHPAMEESVNEWIALARAGDHAAFIDSNLRRIYSDGYYQKYKHLIPLVGSLVKPDSYDRFFIQANACLTHDASGRLACIQAKTLVIGGGQDAVLDGNASRELAAGIPDASLKMYPLWGHGLYDEVPDFNQAVLDFLLS